MTMEYAIHPIFLIVTTSITCRRKEQPPCGSPSRLFKLYVVVIASPAGDLNSNGISADALHAVRCLEYPDGLTRRNLYTVVILIIVCK